MKKIKLCGVSLCTLLAATGANAAGYTCEELIEYTSCNPGYYFADLCPNGTIYPEGMCWDPVSEDANDMTEEECRYEWLSGAYCVALSAYTELPADAIYGNNCYQCPKGSICAGGTADKTPCPAGSYCDDTGLIEPTGQCAKGTYSAGGAVECFACPDTGLTDKDGNLVVATTATTGATGIMACHIGDNVEFQDDKGIYHFKSNCAPTYTYSEFLYNEDLCLSVGGTFSYEPGPGDMCIIDGAIELTDVVYSPEDGYCYFELNGPIDEAYGTVWDGTKCTCPGKWYINEYEYGCKID